MRRYRVTIVVLFVLFASTCVRHIPAATLFQTSDFQSGDVDGWQGAGPTNVATGGPAGESDRFLKITSTGANGPNSVPALYNNGADWVGDFSGINALTVDMMNAVDGSPLDMRLVLFGPSSLNVRWTSVDPVTVPGDGQWHSYAFSILEDALARTRGSGTFAGLIEDVERIMLRNDSGTPSAGGTAIAAVLGLDNIRLTFAGVGLTCDFDGDGTCDIADIDRLMVDAETGGTESDMNDDGIVNVLDRDLWLASAADARGLVSSFLVGDTNLDQAVNAADLNAIGRNWQKADVFAWSEGNVTTGGGAGVNVADLNALGLNWQASSAGVMAAAVPEPSNLVILISSAFAVCCFRRCLGCRLCLQ